jgi:hypothetical protein
MKGFACPFLYYAVDIKGKLLSLHGNWLCPPSGDMPRGHKRKSEDVEVGFFNRYIGIKDLFY